ncbi:S26 family signal peptidase [Streptomyces sp. RKAG293]|uniref:S26 family signal peptidase n=1 Tax=Streptomyces sp. RKAG293 TaxID=2893403 RepID=UPI00203398C7|nr:S26 family signal peptidase [Streptomyces sp. RKAG293]MCM2420610.1 S26 family signal peptidase [Streptomyces sp. RKAG293]
MNLIISISIAFLALLAAARCMIFLVIVRGRSMEPQYYDGDRVLAVKGGLFGRPKVHDVVVVRRSGGGDRGRTPGLFIKNVVAAPGDRVPELFVGVTGAAAGDSTPEGRYLVLGRHRASEDSKQWGYVAGAEIVGKVLRPRAGQAVGSARPQNRPADFRREA